MSIKSSSTFSKRKFPCIGVDQEGVVVLFPDAEEKPVILYAPQGYSDLVIGNNTDIDLSECIEFKGTITIECT